VQEHQDRQGPASNALLTLLTIGTGAVDATSILSAERVFSSVNTGNLVLLGAAAGWHGPALGAGVAVAAYAAGVASGARIRKEPAGRAGLWPRAVMLTLTIELAVLAGFSVVWELVHTRPGAWHALLLALLAGAMGLQSVAVRKLGGVSTTYLTGTMTAFVAGLVSGESRDRSLRSLVLLVSITAGAALGALVLHLDPVLTPLVLAGPLAIVVVVATIRSRQPSASSV